MEDNNTELGVIIAEIKSLPRDNHNFCVSFVHRQANSVGYVLATRAILLDNHRDYYHVPPSVAETIYNEMA